MYQHDQPNIDSRGQAMLLGLAHDRVMAYLGYLSIRFFIQLQQLPVPKKNKNKKNHHKDKR
jgi:hypothetical protein